MILEPITREDLALRISIETDPSMMAELGGPRAIGDIREAHERSLKAIAGGSSWWFKIITGENAPPAGVIGIWSSSFQEANIDEMGWMILPACQGRGLATRAGQEILARARRQNKFATVHAFPGINNRASNRICEKLGFRLVEECRVEFSGRILPCNHWLIELLDGSKNAGE